QRTERIDAMLAMLHVLLQECRDHRDGSYADRQVDPEDQWPADLPDQEGAERWTKNSGHAEHTGDQSLHMRTFSGRINVAQDRSRDRLYAAGAEALQSAEQDQRNHAVREAAQGRTDQEQSCAGIERLLAA